MGSFFQDVIMNDPRFTSTDRIADLQLLEPVTRAAVLGMIADAAAQGVALMVFETYRSQERQQLLFSQGASQLRTVGVHHFGLACDIVKSVNGQPSWNGDFSFFAALAKGRGLIWGGDWGTPLQHHSFHDTDHVQRCAVPMQDALFALHWYPDDDYNPYAIAANV